MKALKFLPFVLLLTACVHLQVKSPQDAINEANVVLTATAQLVKENVTNGVMTKEEGKSVLDEVKKYSVQVDSAQALLLAGNPLEAQNQIKLLNSAILSLQKRVAEKARAK